MSKLETSVYLVLEPQHDYGGRPTGLKVDRMILSKPTKLSSKHVAFKLNIAIDAKAFEAFTPEASVSIEDGRVLVTPKVGVATPEVDTEPEKA